MNSLGSYPLLNSGTTKLKCSYARALWGRMGRLLILALYEELIAGYGQRRHQNHKLLEVHFPVLVLIQVPHDLLHHQWIGTSLGQTHQQEHEEAQGKKQ